MNKILYILDEFSPLSETFVYNQIKELSKSQKTFVLCNKRINSTNFPFKDFKEFSIKKKTIGNRLQERNIFLFLKNKERQNQINNVLVDFKPNSIIIHFGPNFLKNIYNIRTLNIPIFVFFHGYDVTSLVQRSKTYVWSMHKALSLKNVFPIAISKAIKKQMVSAFNINKDITVCYLGIDTNLFQPHDSNIQEEKVFIQISRLVEKKGLFYTIHAFKRFRELNPLKRFKFIIVGNGPLKETLKKETILLGLQKEITFLGAKSQKQIAEYLKKSNVYIQNSITAHNGDTEGLPISIMEAMATDLPVIVSKHSGIPELVSSTNGILTEEKNIESIVHAISQIWDFTPKNNRNKIIQSFSIENSVSKILQLIQKHI